MASSSPSPRGDDGKAEFSTLLLDTLPPIFLLPTHLTPEEVDELEDTLISHHAPITYDINEANIVLSRIEKKRRAILELRARQLWTEEVVADAPTSPKPSNIDGQPPKKKRRLSPFREEDLGGLEAGHVNEGHSNTEAEDETRTQKSQTTISLRSPESNDIKVQHFNQISPKLPSEETSPGDLSLQFSFNASDFADRVTVVRTEWLEASLQANQILPLDQYMVYQGRPISQPNNTSRTTLPAKDREEIASDQHHSAALTVPSTVRGIIERATAEASALEANKGFTSHAKFQDRHPRGRGHKAAALLPRTTTGEEEESSIPPPPDWVKNNHIYACQRASPLHPPNEEFINALLKIKQARLLSLDEIGVRAYSTAIAAITAYPYKLTSSHEVLTLPGCEKKIASLFNEWKQNNGHIQEVTLIENDPEQKVLRLLTDIWGVGATTARDFYYHRNWRDLDDVVEFGWDSLSRVQQIGVKYYDEFLQGIPRAEVDEISKIICHHASLVRPNATATNNSNTKGIECITVGGYRRGKPICGDVDFILSHRDDHVTKDLIIDVVASLETAGYITHTLTLHTTQSNREQQPLPPRNGSGPRFDSLDKALVVWQDPDFPSTTNPNPNNKTKTKTKTKKNPNPNPHRRVDIIITPWRTIGCAILGWSGDTTFERDLRRYAKNVHGWKFDSSGVTERASGRWVDLEGGDDTWEGREKSVFERLGLIWRDPGERCTR